MQSGVIVSPIALKNSWSVPIQVAVLAIVVAGSLALLAFDVIVTRSSPERERDVREQLTAASRQMTSAAHSFAGFPPESEDAVHQLNRELGEVTERILRDFPDIEGGFYADDRLDRFLGYAFPSRAHPPRERDKSDPPPLEAPYIRLQARESLSSPPGETRLSVRDVEASRVMILTEPVGSARPARLATWLMYRLVDPRQLGNQVRRYQASTAMAIGGLALAAVLLINLGRTLHAQRQQEARLRDELRRSEHLAALGKLLAGVAHEVRNPLAAIRSTVQLWDRLPEQTRTPQSLQAVVAAVDQLNQTVTQLLYFSRADHAERQPLETHQLLRETVAMIAAQAAQQNVTLHWQLSPLEFPVAGSPTGLRQVFINLLQNALQAMPTGGELVLSSCRSPDATQGSIEVRDSGRGVPPEDRPRLFEPFFTTRPMGTGLGLALCREIVLQHGGAIEFLAGTKAGSVFRVTLPLRKS